MLENMSQITIESTVRTSEKNLHAADIAGEWVLMDNEQGCFFGFNSIGNSIWPYLREPIKVSSLCEVLSQQYSASKAVIERDLIQFLEELERNGFVNVD